MRNATPRCMDFEAWYASLPDEQQIEVLEELRKMAQEAGITVTYRRLTAACIETLTTQDTRILTARINPHFSLN